MSEAKYHIDTADQMKAKFRAAYDCATMLIQHGGVVVTVGKLNRSSDQNRRCHAMLADIARQAEWAGQKFPAEIWKRLCVAAWLRECGGKPMLIPALDGNGVDIIFERTSKLTVKQMASLIEWLFALGAELGVSWTDPEVRSQCAAAEMSKQTNRSC